MRRRAALLLLPAMLAACKVGPDYRGPPAVAAAAVARGRFVRTAGADYAPTPGPAHWWEALRDPMLSRLVEAALASSPSLEIAQAKVRQARAVLRQQRAAMAPRANAAADYLHANLPGIGINEDADVPSSNLDFYTLGLNASWEVDLLGGGRRGVEAARAKLGAGYADLADAQVSVAAQVAEVYVDLRATQQRMMLNARSAALQRQALTLVRQRVEAGAAGAPELERRRFDLETSEAQDAPLAARVEEDLDTLAALTGETPGALDAALSPGGAIPLPPTSIPIGDPAALIAHRPDVRAAERMLAASTAEVGVEKAKLYPRLQFMGILGLGGDEPHDVVDLSKLTSLLAPTLTWSALDFGKARAAIRQADAARDEAAAAYGRTVLDALQDAETSLSRFGHDRQQVAMLARAEAAAGRAADLQQLRLRAGTTSRVEALDAQRQHLSASLSLSEGEARLTDSYVAVEKSLGLGWSDRRAAQTARR